MRTLVIIAHPNLQASRINRSWAEELQAQENVTIHSLYGIYPDGAIDVRREQQLLDSHDRIIFQYPLYWYSTPSLLKQWFDQVLELGWAYGPGGEHLSGKEIGIAISTGGPADSYQPGAYNLFTLHDYTKPIQALAYHVLASYLPPFILNDARNVTDEQLAASRKAYIEHLATAQPVALEIAP